MAETADKDVLRDIHWTDDCQGKKDFDSEIFSLSTRYWPRGGGFSVITRQAGASELRIEGNDARPEIKPSAVSSIYLLGEKIARAEFEAETEEEVKRLVEAWARARITRVYEHIQELWRAGALQ